MFDIIIHILKYFVYVIVNCNLCLRLSAISLLINLIIIIIIIMCSTLLNKILQDLSSKIPPQKKFLDIAAPPRSAGGQQAIFVKKMHFSGRK